MYFLAGYGAVVILGCAVAALRLPPRAGFVEVEIGDGGVGGAEVNTDGVARHVRGA